MGFKEVYECLLDFFPQVDARVLKAVAIEHPKDADDAAIAVVTEVIPYLSKHALVSNPSLGENIPSVYNEAEHEEELDLLRRRRAIMGKAVASSEELRVMAEKIVIQNFTDSTYYTESDGEVLETNPSPAWPCGPDMDSEQFPRDVELILLKPSSGEKDIQLGSGCASGIHLSTCVDEENTECGQAFIHSGKMQSSSDKRPEINIKTKNEQQSRVMSSSSVPDELDMVFRVETSRAESNIDAKSLEVKEALIERTAQGANGPPTDDFDEVSSSPIASRTNVFSLEVENSAVVDDQAVNDDAISSSPLASESKNYFIEEELAASKDHHHSDKTKNMCDLKQETEIELLEEIIESAEDSKKTLFSEIESAMNMITEVELQERSAEQAKEEAAKGGLDVLVQVEELKMMLAHAKEANDMHAGEIYGEKAIFATEVRELQARLLSLSDERDRTLAILDEMQQNLEARLAVAKYVTEDAEQKKLGKEEIARNALSEQEAIMEKVVQESKILQDEAEKNSKLRDFLMDRGRVVDALQGEILVICKDIRLLKDNFDEHVPLNESFSSSQTSCILASSSRATGLLEPGETAKKPMKTSRPSNNNWQSPIRSPREGSPTSSIHEQSPKTSTRNGSPASSTHGQTPIRSPRETNPSTSIIDPTCRLEREKMTDTSPDDEWDLLEHV